MISLLDRAKRALVLNAAFNVFRDFLGLVVMLVLVRLLEPEQYGQFALVTAVIGFISVFAHQNFIAHTLQVRNDDEIHYQDHFTAGGLIQIAMFVITNITAVILSYFDAYASVSTLIHVMSIGFLLEWPCELRLKMLERSLNWGRLRLLHAIGLVFSSALAIIMAFLGAGVYALLVPGILVTVPFIFDLFFILRWRPTWAWSSERYVPALKFGLTRIVSGLAGRARRLVESGAVVYVFGFASAGLLDRAVSLGMMFCQRAASQIMYTLYPIVTKLEPNSDEYRVASSIVLRGVTWFTIPIAVVLVVLAIPFVNVVYGNNWGEVIPLVPTAVTLGAVSAVSYVIYMLLLGHKEERRCMTLDIFELAGTLAALGLLLREGLITYLLGLVCVRLLGLFFSAVWLLRCGGINRLELSNALFPAMLASGVAYSLCQGVVTISDWSVHNSGVAVAYAVLFLLAYVTTLRTLFADPLSELVEYLPANGAIGRFLRFRPNPA